MKNSVREGLVALKSLKKYKVAAADHDIRGWDVVTSDRRRVGVVDDLIVDEAAMKVRYVVLKVDHKVLETKSDSYMLMPIAGAALDPDDKRVYLEDVDSERLLTIPAYDHRRITRGYERVVRDMFQWEGSAGRTERPDFYDHPAYREGRLYRRRHDDEPLVDGPATDPRAEPLDSRSGNAPVERPLTRDDRPLEEDVREKRTR